MALPLDTGLLATPRRSSLERALCLFTDVRPGEGLTALVMVANVFLILCAYYFVKPLRDGWIAIADIGGFSNVEVKAYTSFAQAARSSPMKSSSAVPYLRPGDHSLRRQRSAHQVPAAPAKGFEPATRHQSEHRPSRHRPSCTTMRSGVTDPWLGCTTARLTRSRRAWSDRPQQ